MHTPLSAESQAKGEAGSWQAAHDNPRAEEGTRTRSVKYPCPGSGSPAARETGSRAWCGGPQWEQGAGACLPQTHISASQQKQARRRVGLPSPRAVFETVCSHRQRQPADYLPTSHQGRLTVTTAVF